MADLIENTDKRQRLARQAAPGIARFSCAKIVDDWEQLLEQARDPRTNEDHYRTAGN
jgi:hypothetical protein